MKTRNTNTKSLEDIGWDCESTNKWQATDLQDFLKIRKSQSHVYFFPFKTPPRISLNFYKSVLAGSKVGHIALIAALDQNKKEYFVIQIASKSDDELIHKNFKSYFEKLKWERISSFLDKKDWITYHSNAFYSPAEVEEALQHIKNYQALPDLIIQQIKMGCGLISSELTENTSPSLVKINLFSEQNANFTSIKKEDINSNDLKKML